MSTWQTEGMGLGPTFKGLSAPHSRPTGDLGWQECKMCDKEEHDPSPERKGLKCHAKEVRLLGLRESATDLSGGMTGSGVRCRTVGNSVRMGWRGASRSRQRGTELQKILGMIG